MMEIMLNLAAAVVLLKVLDKVMSETYWKKKDTNLFLQCLVATEDITASTAKRMMRHWRKYAQWAEDAAVGEDMAKLLGPHGYRWLAMSGDRYNLWRCGAITAHRMNMLKERNAMRERYAPQY